MNFTGVESACDFLFYQLGRLLKTSQSQSSKTASEGNLDIDGIVLNGCKNITIWSLHYLYQAVDKSIFDLSSSSVPVNILLVIVIYTISCLYIVLILFKAKRESSRL